MASGIDWFRWHHGSVTDQKFPLVARRAGASVAEVIAVWACLLERASMNEKERGWLGDALDFEAMDCALGMDDGRTAAIFNALQQRDLVDANQHITAWPHRQPKREREDDTTAARKAAQRAREAEKAPNHDTPDESTSSHVTPRHATSHQKTPRGEESREEKKETTSSDELVSATAAPKRGSRLPEPWALPLSWGEWAIGEYPLWTPDTVRRIAADFADHWHGKSGKDATKLDWLATWRKWCRSEITQRQFGPQAGARGGGGVNRQEAIEQRNREVGARWLAEQEALDATH